ncbi:MAG: sensor histidine kinase [Egibacteraceae bacterium]
MSERNLERLGMAAGAIAWLAVGVPVLLEQLLGSGDIINGPAWVWWLAYLGYLVAFMLADADRLPGWLTPHWLLGAQTVLGGIVYAMTLGFGWTAVLLVVTAVTAAYVLDTRGTMALVAAQTAFIAVASLFAGADALNIFLSVVVYGSFQAFSVLVVWSELREAEARASLAEANAQLRAATVLLDESSRVTERLRIARDLHDLIGHQLTALALELEVASHRSSSPASEHVSRARRIAKELLSDVRSAVGELREPTPGLRSALEAVVADLPHPEIHLHVPAHVEADEERTMALVRCVQEIVTNAVRHADADHLWIRLAATEGGGTRLEARDDGRGVAALRPGNGLTGIRERIEQLGGEVAFEVGPGRGFLVVAEVPAP